MPEQLLHRLQVPGRVESALAGGMAGLVHPLAGSRPRWDDTCPLEASPGGVGVETGSLSVAAGGFVGKTWIWPSG